MVELVLTLLKAIQQYSDNVRRTGADSRNIQTLVQAIQLLEQKPAEDTDVNT